MDPVLTAIVERELRDAERHLAALRTRFEGRDLTPTERMSLDVAAADVRRLTLNVAVRKRG